MFDTNNEITNIDKEHKLAQESGEVFDSGRQEQI